MGCHRSVGSLTSFLLILAGAGVITQEQSAEAAPVLNSTIQAVSVVIAGVLQIINIFFKQGGTSYMKKLVTIIFALVLSVGLFAQKPFVVFGHVNDVP